MADTPKLYRVILQEPELEQATGFYLKLSGEKTSLTEKQVVSDQDTQKELNTNEQR